MSTFTPGPWMFDDEAYIFADPMSEGKMIAEMRGWGWLQYKGEEAAIAEQEANGRLISAAPEMYEALRAMLKADKDSIGYAIACDNARNALAKADGK